MHRGCRVAVFAAALGVGSAAGAHEFECQKRVNGQAVARVDEYPTTVRFDHRLRNTHPTTESVALSAEDPVLARYGWSFPRATPVAVAVGSSVDSHFMLQVDSYEACRALAAGDGLDDGALDTTFRVVWPLGEDQCGARLLCEQPYVPPPPPDCQVCPEPRVTRDEGFYKTHEEALQRCVDLMPIELGSLGTVSTLPQALGVLWGSPTLYPNGEPRTALDTARMLLARQALVAHCNAYLLGYFTVPAALLWDGQGALSGNRCQDMERLRLALREQNVEGLHQPLEFDPGPATPAHARSIAEDFTRPSGQSCQ